MKSDCCKAFLMIAIDDDSPPYCHDCGTEYLGIVPKLRVEQEKLIRHPTMTEIHEFWSNLKKYQHKQNGEKAELIVQWAIRYALRDLMREKE